MYNGRAHLYCRTEYRKMNALAGITDFLFYFGFYMAAGKGYPYTIYTAYLIARYRGRRLTQLSGNCRFIWQSEAFLEKVSKKQPVLQVTGKIRQQNLEKNTVVFLQAFCYNNFSLRCAITFVYFEPTLL